MRDKPAVQWALGVLTVGIGVAATPARGQLAVGGPDVAATLTISKETTAILGPLRVDGTVDYVAAINQKYGQGVSPLTNGFVAMLKVVGTENGIFFEGTKDAELKLCGAQRTLPGINVFQMYWDYMEHTKGLDGAPLDAATQAFSNARIKLWTVETYPDIAAYLKLQEPLLTLATEASWRSRWWSPCVTVDGRTLLSTTMPSLGVFRSVVETLCVRATMRAGTGDINGAFADIAAARRLARLMGSGPTFIERLGGISAETRAVEALSAVAGGGTLTQAQCAAAAKSFDEIPPMPTVIESVDIHERWSLLDTTVELAIGRLQLVAAAGPKNSPDDPGNIFHEMDCGAVNWNVVLRQINQFYDRQIAAMNSGTITDLADRGNALEKEVAAWHGEAEPFPRAYHFARGESETAAAYTDRVAHGILGLLAPSLWRAEEIRRRTLMESQMTRVVIAAAEFKAKNGHWPAQAEQLIPDFLKELPCDIYSNDGAAVKYVLTERGPRVSSVWPKGIGVGPG